MPVTSASGFHTIPLQHNMWLTYSGFFSLRNFIYLSTYPVNLSRSASWPGLMRFKFLVLFSFNPPAGCSLLLSSAFLFVSCVIRRNIHQ